MTVAKFVFSPQAARDLVEIWQHIAEDASEAIADRIEAAILEKISFLAKNPGGGHTRKDLTDQPVTFFPVYAYMIVYRAKTKPLQIVTIIHGRRDLERLLPGRI